MIIKKKLSFDFADQFFCLNNLVFHSHSFLPQPFYITSDSNKKLMKSILILIFSFLQFSVFSQTFPDSYSDGKYVTVNGAKLYVVLVGKGDPLIIIPGGPGGTHVGYRVFDSLAKDNQLVYFDAFGRGKSDTAKDVKEYSLERDIEDIEGLRIALHFDQLNVLGKKMMTTAIMKYKQIILKFGIR
jgi:hypothetical protein